MLAPATSRAGDDVEAAEAKKHYEEGTKAFNLGEYPRAIVEFKATYNAKPDPLLLYNIAQSYRLQGDAGQAVFFYKSFLRNMPNAPNRKEVEGKIKALEKQLAEQKKEPAAAPVPVVPIVEPAANVPPPPPLPPAAAATPAVTPSAPLELRATPPAAEAAPAAPPPAIPPAVTTTQVDLTAPAAPAEPTDRPIYKKWWFWVGSAAVVLVIGGVIAAAASSHKAPSTPLGTYSPTFM